MAGGSMGPLAATAQIDTYTVGGAHTWTKPALAKSIKVVVVAPGGSGGSGCRGAAATIRCGGGSGGGGGVASAVFDAASIPASVTVTVGAAGTPGAAIGTDTTVGAAGAGGTSSSFGIYVNALPGGPGGGGGVGVAGAGGYAGVGDSFAGAGVSSDAAGLPGPASTDNWQPTGGAAGGGLTAANAAHDGGPTGSVYVTTNTWGIGGTVAGALPTQVNMPAGSARPGSGGGGGASEVAAVAQDGAAGGLYGGGGGGGGASTNGFASGAGGLGGPGIVVVITGF